MSQMRTRDKITISEGLRNKGPWKVESTRLAAGARGGGGGGGGGTPPLRDSSACRASAGAASSAWTGSSATGSSSAGAAPSPVMALLAFAEASLQVDLAAQQAPSSAAAGRSRGVRSWRLGATWVTAASSRTPKARSPTTRQSTKPDSATAKGSEATRRAPVLIRISKRRRLPEGDLLLRTFGEGARSKCFLDHRCLLRGCHLKELRSKAVARYSHGMALTEGERPKKELKEKELSGNVLPAESVEEGRELSGGGPRSGCSGCSGGASGSGANRGRSLRRDDL